ncbi:MAG TPA: TonB-dependent receptor [Steroidobacteraceae bacterium]
MRHRRCNCLILVCLSVLAAAASFAQDKLSFDIPAQSASSAIRAWARQSGLQVFASQELLDGVQANAVHGDYLPLQAVQLLIEGTGLEVVSTGEKTVTIRRRSDPRPQPSSNNSDPDNRAVELEEVVVTGSRIKRAGFDTVEAALVNGSEQIQKRGYTNVAQALNETPGFALSGNDPIGRSQSRLTTAQSFVDLFGLGSQRTLTLVNGRRFVSSNTVSAGSGTNPGEQVDLNVIPIGLIDRVETIAIGGAPVYGSDAIAGTVNIILKKDFHGLQTDLQYGNSQHGGTGGYTARTLVGTNFADDRGNMALSVEYNKQNGIVLGDRAGLAYNVANPDPPPLRLIIPNFVYSAFSEGGIPYNLAQLGVTNAYITSDGTPTGTPLQFGRGGVLVPYRPAPDLSGAGLDIYANGGDGVSAAKHISLLSPTERTIATALGHFDLTPDVSVFFEANYAHSEGTEVSDFADFTSPLLTGTLMTFSVNNPFLPAATRNTLLANGVTDQFVVSRNMSDLIDGNGLARTAVELFRGVVGMQGSFDAFGEKLSWDVSYNQGESRNSSKTTYINDPRFQNAIDAVTDPAGNIVCATGGSCVPLNVFGVNSFSAAAAHYVLDVGRAISENRQHIATTDLSGHLPFGIGAAEHIAFNVGAEYRKEEGSFSPDSVLTAGSSFLGLPLATGYVPTSGSFNTRELYTELVTPLVSQSEALPGVKSFEFDGAARYVDNSIAGGDTTWSIGTRFSPRLPAWGDGLVFRAVYTRAIRAPSITELFAGGTPSRDGIDDPCDASLYNQGPDPAVRIANCTKALAALGYASPADFHSTTGSGLSPIGTSSGNRNLRNEVAKSWSVGLVYQPTELPKLHVAVDWSNIHLLGGIENLGINELLASCYDNPQFPNNACASFQRLNASQLASNPTRVVADIANGYATGYINTASLQFTGLIAAADYGFDFGDLVSSWKNAGSLRFGTKLFYRDKYILTANPGDAAVNRVGDVGLPRYAGQFNFFYTLKAFDAMLQALWTSAVKVDQTLGPDVIPAVYNDIGNYWKFNATLGYTFFDHVHAQLVVNNLFDKRPTVAEMLSENYGTYDIIGRSYMLEISGRF